MAQVVLSWALKLTVPLVLVTSVPEVIWALWTLEFPLSVLMFLKMVY